MTFAGQLRGLVAGLMVWLVAIAPVAVGAELEAGGLWFSDELGGFRLVAASGSGSRDDPIVLVEEITGTAPVVLVVRQDLGRDRWVSPSERVLLRSMVKIVINRTPWEWSGFDLELRDGEGRPSIYLDGLSFDQANAIRGPVNADLFHQVRAQDEPHDRLRFDGGRVDPDQTLRMAFKLLDINPRPLFYLAQEPVVLLADQTPPWRFALKAR